MKKSTNCGFIFLGLNFFCPLKVAKKRLFSFSQTSVARKMAVIDDFSRQNQSKHKKAPYHSNGTKPNCFPFQRIVFRNCFLPRTYAFFSALKASIDLEIVATLRLAAFLCKTPSLSALLIVETVAGKSCSANAKSFALIAALSFLIAVLTVERLALLEAFSFAVTKIRFF